MSKYKVGYIVNVIYDFDKIIKGKVIGFNALTNQYMVEILENKDDFLKEKIYGIYELDLKPIYQENTIDLNKSHKKHMDLISDVNKQLKEIDEKEISQAKPSNDFIYFKDLDIVVPKKVFQEDVLNIQPTSFIKDNSIVNGFGVFLYSNCLQIKQFKTKEQAQEFIKQLANALGSDIL